MKVARAVVGSTPGLDETLVRDWRGAARVYAEHGITEAMFPRGVADVAERSAATSETEPRVLSRPEGSVHLYG